MQNFPVINLWQSPSNIADQKCWMVYLARDNERTKSDYYVRELNGFLPEQWGTVESRIQQGKWPSDIVRISLLEASQLKQQLVELQHFCVPLNIDDAPSGYDGTNFGLELFSSSYNTRIRFTWWSTGPKQWKPVVDWYSTMVNKLISQLEDS